MTLPPRLTIKEAMALLKLSKTTIYERIKTGALHTVRDGGRVFVTGAELQRYLDASAAASSAPHQAAS